MLEFVHMRTIDAAPGFGPGDDQGDPEERAQLLALFRMFGPALDEAAMLAFRYPADADADADANADAHAEAEANAPPRPRIPPKRP